MALMDIAASEDLFAAIAHCLKPDGVAVVVTMHPVFKNPSNLQYTIGGEMAGGDQREGILISHYLTPRPKKWSECPVNPKGSSTSTGPSPTS